MITKYELQQTTNKIIAECIRSCLWTMTLFLKSNGKIKLSTRLLTLCLSDFNKDTIYENILKTDHYLKKNQIN